jgi:tetratricopeptide (TPR) repeat protein
MPGPAVRALAATVKGASDVERILGGIRAVAENLAYDPAGNQDQFNRAAEELYTGKTLGGCSEFALAQLAMMRALGYPARLVLTMNAKWVARYRENPLAVPNGHGFVEVWVRGRWLLADPTGFTVYEGCAGPNLPSNEILLARALDFWDAGFTDTEASNAYLRGAAREWKGEYVKPGCRELGSAQFDFPKAFTNLGAVFQEKGRPDLAARLYRKALHLAPGIVTARVGLGECLLELGEPGQAAEEFEKALAASPGDARAKRGLSEARARADAHAAR